MHGLATYVLMGQKSTEKGHVKHVMTSSALTELIQLAVSVC